MCVESETTLSRSGVDATSGVKLRITNLVYVRFVLFIKYI